MSVMELICDILEQGLTDAQECLQMARNEGDMAKEKEESKTTQNNVLV